MPIIKLPDEELPAFPGRKLSTFYSTRPVNVDEFLRAVDGLDGVVIRGIGFMTTRPIEPDEEVQVGDVIVVNMNHSLEPPLEDRMRTNYHVVEEVDNGYTIREIPVTLIFEEDVTQQLLKIR